MAPQQVVLEVPSELVAMGNALKALITDLVAKKSVEAIIADVLPSLVAAGAGIADAGADLKASADARAYIGMLIEQALDPIIIHPAPAA